MSRFLLLAAALGWLFVATAGAQLVCLPAPRLLTVFPMGGQHGTTVDVTITGENLDEVSELLFSDPEIVAKPKLAEDGTPVPNKFEVAIAPATPVGVYEARAMTRLGISSSRIFSVSAVEELTPAKPGLSLAAAQPLKIGTLCNGAVTKRAVDFYSFEGKKGERVVVDCAAAGIDSKLVPVLILADAQGHDLMVNRTGGVLDFTPAADGQYFVEVHSLTFQGGPEHFYRLALNAVPAGQLAVRQPSTMAVDAFSREPATIPVTPVQEIADHTPQKITLPCELAGKFFPAAHVDTFDFDAKKGETWSIEVVSERLGLPTDPFVLVQQVKLVDGKETLADVAEFNDIPSPVKVSTNGYSYDGPPYNAGTADSMGQLTIKEDGRYRLQIRDLFGGTRNDPRNVYRLSIRQPAPDFSLVAWALHMNLRNGDRAALSKPLSLRQGATMALEVVGIRHDGFDGEIELGMEGLPAGLTACGLKIPSGKNCGTLLITAAEGAPRTFGTAKLFGRAEIAGQTVTRPCRLASMVWPVRDASQEIPVPRLLNDVVVSTTDAEPAPVAIAPAASKVFEAKAGEKLEIPLKLAWHGEFSGALKLKAFGAGFETVKEFDVPLQTATANATLDLAALKTPPGDYTLAFYGSAVAKYRDNPEAVQRAEAARKKAEQDAAALAATAKTLADEVKSAPAEKKAAMEREAATTAEKLKLADARKAEAGQRMKAATASAMPQDTVDIVVSAPIHIRVLASTQP
jgi:hypothetical protein